MPALKNLDEPCCGKLHARIDGKREEIDLIQHGRQRPRTFAGCHCACRSRFKRVSVGVVCCGSPVDGFARSGETWWLGSSESLVWMCTVISGDVAVFEDGKACSYLIGPPHQLNIARPQQPVQLCSQLRPPCRRRHPHGDSSRLEDEDRLGGDAAHYSIHEGAAALTTHPMLARTSAFTLRGSPF
jgi:hypothetical protein